MEPNHTIAIAARVMLCVKTEELYPEEFKREVTFITVRNEVAKVMFFQVYVCPQGRSASVHAGIPTPPREQTPLWNQAPPPGADTPLGPGTPLEQTPQEQTPSGNRPPRETATVADGTHLTIIIIISVLFFLVTVFMSLIYVSFLML